MANTPTIPASEPMLPTLFIMAATFALSSEKSSIDPQHDDLERAARLAAPIVSRTNMLDGDQNLLLTACDEAERMDRENDQYYPQPLDASARIAGVRFNGATAGLHIGLAAGYLLAQLVAGKDSAR